jgi:hypothetical protein
MENAEGDEGLRKGQVTGDTDQDRAERDQRDPSPECRGVTPARRMTAGSINQQHECADDHAAKTQPERIVVEVGAYETEPVESNESDKRSSGKRYAAQAVDRAYAQRRRRRGSRLLGTLRRRSARRRHAAHVAGSSR